MKKIYTALKSLKLTMPLLAYLALACLLATLVPQGLPSDEYARRLPPLLARLAVATGFSRFFSSLPFLLPVGLFFLNLATCSIDRLIRELRKKTKRRHGPDILHFGLMILIIAAILGSTATQRGAVSLAVGDRFTLPSGDTVALEAFSFEKYDDGRPKEWTSTLSVAGKAGTVIPSFPVRVNHPLSVQGVSIYQSSHEVAPLLVVRTPDGIEKELEAGDLLSSPRGELQFLAEEGGIAHVHLVTPTGEFDERIGKGESLAGFTVVDLRSIDLSGLMVVRDPFSPLMALALVVTALGLALTFAQKTGDMRK